VRDQAEVLPCCRWQYIHGNTRWTQLARLNYKELDGVVIGPQVTLVVFEGGTSVIYIRTVIFIQHDIP
jgi:hypothetical protein